MVIRVVRIGTSEPAPNFELVAQPNDWEKQVKKATSTASGPTSAREAQYREFWELVLDRVRAEHPDWTRARTSGTSWVNTATGTSGAVISMAWTRAGLVIQIYFESADADLNSTRFDVLYAQREIFEAALGETPVWDEMDGRKAARIVIPSEFTDLTDKNTWPQMIEWLIQKQNALRSALAVVGGVS
ncbi:DUF4268 domain-containing protein [Pseudonocardia sulfidoxydans]|uniref:DUF4268 domain-containing protein n=1 Tax=Pseudonocardia sulfidoxydans TaxID=54011 RepID=UPI003613F1D0